MAAGGWFRPQGRLGADAKRQANTHGSKGTGIEPVTRMKARDGLAAVIQDFLAVDHEDGVAADEVPNLPAQAQGMNRGLSFPKQLKRNSLRSVSEFGFGYF